jgi:uncharacterized membrane protein (DUF485 family)
MKSSRLSFLFSAVLIIVNFVFLYTIVGCKDIVSHQVVPGFTVGMIGFVSIIMFAVALTWIYVQIVNCREKK